MLLPSPSHNPSHTALLLYPKGNVEPAFQYKALPRSLAALARTRFTVNVGTKGANTTLQETPDMFSTGARATRNTDSLLTSDLINQSINLIPLSVDQ